MVAMLWPYLLAKIPGKDCLYIEVWLYLLVTNMINVVVFTGYNLVMIVVYKVKHPFFERYRVMNDPWPW